MLNLWLIINHKQYHLLQHIHATFLQPHLWVIIKPRGQSSPSPPTRYFSTSTSSTVSPVIRENLIYPTAKERVHNNAKRKSVKRAIPCFMNGEAALKHLLDEKMKKAREVGAKQKKLREKEEKREAKKWEQEERKKNRGEKAPQEKQGARKEKKSRKSEGGWPAMERGIIGHQTRKMKTFVNCAKFITSRRTTKICRGSSAMTVRDGCTSVVSLLVLIPLQLKMTSRFLVTNAQMKR